MKTAEERGMEMMGIKMNELPNLAYKFFQHLSSEVGVCGEVYLTAWIVYAQEVEGLECTDSLYKSRPIDKEWFKNEKG